MAAIAKITTKGQTTVPQEVRTELHVEPGDPIACEVRPDGTSTVRRVQPLDVDHLRALGGTLSEWSRPVDDEAYRDLLPLRVRARAVPAQRSCRCQPAMNRIVVTGGSLQIITHPPREIDVRAIVLDVTRIERETGWWPRTELEEGIRNTWNTLLETT